MSYSNEIKNTVFSLNYKYRKTSNILYIIVLFFIVGAIISLPFVCITVDSQARGILRSQKENVKITFFVQGRVSYVNLKNNQTVKKDELLLKIDPLIEATQVQTKKSLLVNLQQQYADLNILCKGNSKLLKTELYQNERNHFLEKLKELKTQKEQFYQLYQRSKKGFEGGIVSAADYEKSSYELKILNRKIATYKKETHNKWQSRKTHVEEQIKRLEGEITQLLEKKKNYAIKAPISGTIVNYSGIKQGAYFNGNEILGEISSDDEIILECFINPKDIGFIRIGQTVKLQMDAFNYNQWGLGKATVYEIDRNLTIDKQQNYFKVRCKLETNELTLKNGFKAKIKKGMTCTARLTLAERSLWNLLFDKVDDWFNPKLIELDD